MVPRRKVRARVRLADSTVYEGALYAPVETVDGRPGRVVDRLNEPNEKYLPLALEDRHLLVNKAGIVTVELRVKEGDTEQDASDDGRELHLQLQLSDGSTLSGRTYAEMPPASGRVLDFMNATAPKFITLLLDDQVLIVNEGYIVAICEDRVS